MGQSTLGARIRSRRIQKDISLRTFAKRLGISHQWMSRIELGHVDISTTRLQQIADLLDTTPGALLPRKKKERSAVRLSA